MGSNKRRKGNRGKGKQQQKTSPQHVPKAATRHAPGEEAEPKDTPSLLSTQQEQALLSLVQGQTTTEAAEMAGVRRETVSQWINHNPDFAEALAQARTQLRTMVLDQLAHASTKAITKLVELLKSHDEEVQLKACKEILVNLPRHAVALRPAPKGQDNDNDSDNEKPPQAPTRNGVPKKEEAPLTSAVNDLERRLTQIEHEQ